MKVYAYQQTIADHHNAGHIKQVVITGTKPDNKEYQEFDVEKLQDVFFDGEKLKVKP